MKPLASDPRRISSPASSNERSLSPANHPKIADKKSNKATYGDGGAENNLETKKQQWHQELDKLSKDFLVLKSNEEQRSEGAAVLVDTATVEDRDGLPVLRAVFDVHHFHPDNVDLSVVDDQLVIEARDIDDKENAVFRKTMIRKIDLPKFVDSKMPHCLLSNDGILTVEMPFHLPPQRRPRGPSVAPIVTDGDGKRKIRLAFMIGSEFTNDDVMVDANPAERVLTISAAYDEEIGKYGQAHRQRELKKQYRLPASIDVESVYHCLSPDGRLFVEITLKDEPAPFKCTVTTEEVETP